MEHGALEGHAQQQLAARPLLHPCHQLLHSRQAPIGTAAPGAQVLAFAQQAAASPDAQHRCGAMTVLAVICEGCAAPLRKRLGEELLPLVLAGLRVRQERAGLRL